MKGEIDKFSLILRSKRSHGYLSRKMKSAMSTQYASPPPDADEVAKAPLGREEELTGKTNKV
jgi:hypothetical protein